MDTAAPTIEVSQEVARESLIAISQFNPDKNLTESKLLPNGPNNVNGFELEESDTAEDYRSKLISISYTQSPDGDKVIPASPEILRD